MMSQFSSILAAVLLSSGCTTYAFELAVSPVPEGGLWSAWGPNEDDIWVVGGQESEGVVLRGSGSGFRPMTLPANTPLLNWVHGRSDTDVWVGGLYGTLLHWNGEDWTDYSVAMDEAIWGIHAVSTEEVYAVGGLSGWSGTTRVALRFNGSDWTPIALPQALDELPALFKVFYDGADIWLVGARGTVLVGDGTDFEQMETGVTEDISTVHSRGDGSVVMVGGLATGVILAGDKDTGVRVLAETPSRLFGVHVADSGDAVVAGFNGYLGTVSVDDGDVETLVSPTALILHAVYGQPDGKTYAVGGDIGSLKDTYTGVILASDTP